MKIHQKLYIFINSDTCEISHYFVLHKLRLSVVGSFSSDITIFPDKVLLKVSVRGYQGGNSVIEHV